MIKKIIFFVVLVAAFVQAANAQLQVGDWKLYSSFSGDNNQSILDTDQIVYYLADGYLFSYDKENQETTYFNKRNDLSDIDITNIYYNYNKKYVLVIYSNSNIDLIYDSGKVVNIPDLKNTVMTSSKTINDADFEGDEIYLATDFGYLVLDDERYLVKESHNYGKKFVAIVANDKFIFVSFDNYIHASNINDNHFEISSFIKTNRAHNKGLIKVDNDYMYTSGGYLNGYDISGKNNNNNLATLPGKVVHGNPKEGIKFVSLSKNGAVVSFSNYLVIEVDKAGNKLRELYLPSEIFTDTNYLSSMENDGSFWGLNSDGISHFSIADNGGITMLSDAFRPNAPTMKLPYYLKYLNNRLYAMSAGPNMYLENNRDFGLASMDSNGTWTDFAPKNVTNFINSNSRNTLMAPYGLIVDPDDPDKIWFGTWWEGTFCVKDNEEIQRFNSNNSPLVLNYVCCCPDLMFDSNKNLWMLSMNRSAYNPVILVLPAEKRFSEVSASDWTSFTLDNIVTTQGARFCITSDNILFMVDNNYPTRFYALDYNNTPFDKSDDRSVTIGSFVDQDGGNFDFSSINSFKEDSNGRVWIGTNTGVGYISNPESVFTDNFYFTRVKVPRNDGTNLADYLLDGVSVPCIEIDGAGRKWIGTNGSGVYVVSEDGTEILQHFTSSNSYLPSDIVYSIAFNTSNNSVYIGTENGLAEYSNDAMSSEADLSNVYAYPNPVRPDYTGYITIKGLMENSMVKITDSTGNIVYSTTSNGGMVTWDGCNMNGKRVDTGIYFVLASQGDAGEGCVTKIMIVR